MFFNSQLCNFCDLKGPSAHTHRESYHFQECNHQERPPYSELSVFNQLAPSGLSSSRLHLLKYLKTAAMNLSIFYYPIKYPKFFFFFFAVLMWIVFRALKTLFLEWQDISLRSIWVEQSRVDLFTLLIWKWFQQIKFVLFQP